MTVRDTVTTDRFVMDYFYFGRGEKVLVILPGLSVTSVMDQAEAVAAAYSVLTDDYTIYLFDRRRDLPEDYTMAQMAEDTAAAIRAAGIRHAAIFGASQGGMIAMGVALCDPDLVDKLILGSTADRVEAPAQAVLDKWKDLALKGKAKELFLTFGEDVYPPQVFAGAKDVLLDMAGQVTPTDLHRFVILTESMRGYDIASKLSRIACPVLILGDTTDRVFGETASPAIRTHLGEGRGDVQIHMYTDCGHAAYDTAPDYTQRMLRFLQG